MTKLVQHDTKPETTKLETSDGNLVGVLPSRRSFLALAVASFTVGCSEPLKIETLDLQEERPQEVSNFSQNSSTKLAYSQSPLVAFAKLEAEIFPEHKGLDELLRLGDSLVERVKEVVLSHYTDGEDKDGTLKQALDSYSTYEKRISFYGRCVALALKDLGFFSVNRADNSSIAASREIDLLFDVMRYKVSGNTQAPQQDCAPKIYPIDCDIACLLALHCAHAHEIDLQMEIEPSGAQDIAGNAVSGGGHVMLVSSGGPNFALNMSEFEAVTLENFNDLLIVDVASPAGFEIDLPTHKSFFKDGHFDDLLPRTFAFRPLTESELIGGFLAQLVERVSIEGEFLRYALAIMERLNEASSTPGSIHNPLASAFDSQEDNPFVGCERSITKALPRLRKLKTLIDDLPDPSKFRALITIARLAAEISRIAKLLRVSNLYNNDGMQTLNKESYAIFTSSLGDLIRLRAINSTSQIAMSGWRREFRP